LDNQLIRTDTVEKEPITLRRYDQASRLEALSSSPILQKKEMIKDALKI
jgi:hypothetical protein